MNNIRAIISRFYNHSLFWVFLSGLIVFAVSLAVKLLYSGTYLPGFLFIVGYSGMWMSFMFFMVLDIRRATILKRLGIDDDERHPAHRR